MALDRATAGLDQFPSATAGGKIIPPSIGNVYGTYLHTLALTASTLQTLPTDASLCDFYCYEGNVCIIFGNQTPAFTADTFKEDQLYIPKRTHVQVWVPSNTFKSIADAVGTLRIQLWRPWKTAGVSSLQTSM